MTKNAKNNRFTKEIIFETLTARLSSQFERVEMKTALLQDEAMNSKIERVIHRVDSTSDRRRDRRKTTK